MLIALIVAQLCCRLTMQVTESYGYTGIWFDKRRTEQYCICPRCWTPLEREYQAYCDRCGQRLDWALVEEDG